jgi:hypothetical protein
MQRANYLWYCISMQNDFYLMALVKNISQICLKITLTAEI